MGDLKIRELSPWAGVEVTGADFSQPLSADNANQFGELFRQYRLLVIRNVELEGDDQVRLCNYCAPVHQQWGFVSNTEETPGFDRDCVLLFHSDFAFTGFSLLGISLYAMEIGDGAVPTRFRNTQLAYERMPEAMRTKFEGLDVLMLANTVDGREDIPARTIRVPDDAPRDRYIRTVMPTVSQHRVTNTPYIVAAEQQASHFIGTTMDESDELLDELFTFMDRDEFIYEHDWVPGDIVIWDNVMLQHGRRYNEKESRRCLRKVTMSDRSMLDILEGTVYAKVTTTK
jgi:alpha-ketoglutarate-dependent taurine dioxygenase